MQHRIFAIFDSKAEAWLPPFMSQNEATALRQIANLTVDSGHPFGSNPEDFAMFDIGSWDDANCRYELEPAPRHLANLVELARARSQS